MTKLTPFPRFRIYFQQVICCCCRWGSWKQNAKNELPPGILLEKHSHSDTVMARSRLCENQMHLCHFKHTTDPCSISLSQTARQKTLSVKWNQSMSETRLYDRRNNMSSRRMHENTYRCRPPPLPRLSSSEFVSRQESLPTATATTPLMAVSSQLNGTEAACTNDVCECLMPHESITTIKYRQTSPHAIMINGDKFKSDSC
jgi:hypothetical protein